MPTPLLFIIYGLFFLLLSEQFNWQSVLAAVLAVTLSQFFLTERRQPSSLKWKKLPRLAVLWCTFTAVLLREILSANLQVARIVLSPKMNINPQVDCYTTQLSIPALLAAFSTAITLTPGTMTLDIAGSTLKIHCLTDIYAASLDQNPVEPILLKIQEVLNG